MRTLTLITIICILFSSCSKERLTGNNEITTEVRRASNFTGIQSSGSNRIHITYGEEFKVVVKGSSNLIPVFDTRVRNKTLELGYENGVNVHDDDIEVFVTMPLIDDVSLSGSGDVDISGNFESTDLFRLSISGSADVEVEDEFDCNRTAVSVSGSGNANLEKILSKHSDIKISGSGNVRITADETLKVRISGSGDVYYSGSPRIDSSVSGSGKVRPSAF